MKINFAELHADVQRFITDKAKGGYFVTRSTPQGPELLALMDGHEHEVDPVPPLVRVDLLRLAKQTGEAAVYEFGEASSAPSGMPVREAFPEGPEGSQRFARAYGAYHAANRAAFDGSEGRKGLADLVPGAKTMPRADFEKLAPADRSAAMRAKTTLTD